MFNPVCKAEKLSWAEMLKNFYKLIQYNKTKTAGLIPAVFLFMRVSEFGRKLVVNDRCLISDLM